ncbi:GNAT family N-acetyltransferase [Humibacter sp. BT305]|uniref:GNAT family N-acetyltransferase n=1 Tax=Cnuibacter physcomitrellae TaxID=1619308 RepID=A0A1X9LM01_9MICO|nr:GNAT family N-acetyltransferase [Cnuibacter physcomitrellae]ARJ06214.1 GNAT family N-acetyltransferase [Cnuibacter physcomitrellae]AXH35123.1 GNAT family N-acetyltransferase [Humibacter sp. BT305]MCS5495995.1 GNAT family N-acetyltransferase [Cnuibacter physcomitrellae]GGI37478.1 N-acetyltransferase [Cnuibacter physcomitrellae]
MVEVRRAVANDSAALARVAAATFPLACPPGSDPADIADFIAANLTEERFAEYLADPARVITVAEGEADRSEFAGYTMLVEGDPSDADVASALRLRPTIELSKVYVREQYHGAGVSRRLVDATIAAALDTTAKGVWLGVNDRNARAVRFYEKSGFERVGRKTFRLGSTLESDFVMERPL